MNYFTNKKTLQLRSLTSIPPQQPTDSFQQRILHLQNYLADIVSTHDLHMAQVHQMIDHTQETVADIESRKDRLFARRAEEIEYQLSARLEEEKQEMMGRRAALKQFMQEKGKVVCQIISSEAKEEKQLEHGLQHTIENQLRDIKKEISKEKEYQQKADRQEKRQIIGERVNRGVQKLDKEASSLRHRNEQTNRQVMKLTKGYLSILQSIKEGSQDRQVKEQQLLHKIEQVGSVDRTNEETLLKIQ